MRASRHAGPRITISIVPSRLENVQVFRDDELAELHRCAHLWPRVPAYRQSKGIQK
jgi:hypothetical protein